MSLPRFIKSWPAATYICERCNRGCDQLFKIAHEPRLICSSCADELQDNAPMSTFLRNLKQLALANGWRVWSSDMIAIEDRDPGDEHEDRDRWTAPARVTIRHETDKLFTMEKI